MVISLISREEFAVYIATVNTVMTNNKNTKMISSISGLSLDKITIIRDNYSELAREYPYIANSVNKLI